MLHFLDSSLCFRGFRLCALLEQFLTKNVLGAVYTFLALSCGYDGYFVLDNRSLSLWFLVFRSREKLCHVSGSAVDGRFRDLEFIVTIPTHYFLRLVRYFLDLVIVGNLNLL